MQAGSKEGLQDAVLQLLGLRLSGLGAAVTLPVLLTAALFLGPLTVWALDWYQGVLAGRRGRPLIQVERLHLLSLLNICQTPVHCKASGNVWGAWVINKKGAYGCAASAGHSDGAFDRGVCIQILHGSVAPAAGGVPVTLRISAAPCPLLLRPQPEAGLTVPLV